MVDNSEESSEFEITVTPEALQNYKRLDKWLAEQFPGYSRTFIKKIFEDGLIQSESSLSLSKMPKVGTELSLMIPPPMEWDVQAENIPLPILYEDEHLVVVNKPAGMVVHPAPGNYTGTLVNAILHHCPDIKGVGNVRRPGIVHRLDKGTSGVMVVAKEQSSHEGLILLFSKHIIKRQYWALSSFDFGVSVGVLESNIGRHPKDRLKMKANVIGGKKAVTHFVVKQSFNGLGRLFELTLHTGRTHQIRVHLSELLRHPIAFDELYGNPNHDFQKWSKFMDFINQHRYPLLHAKVLGFRHPITQEDLYFEQPPPLFFSNVLESLLSRSS